MNSNNSVSRRRFLSTTGSSVAASYLSYPGFSLALGGAASVSSDSPRLPWRDQGVLNLANSPYAKLHSIPVRAVTIGAVNQTASDKEPLYIPVVPEPPKTQPANLTLIPYYAWANRQPTSMQVWIPFRRT